MTNNVSLNTLLKSYASARSRSATCLAQLRNHTLAKNAFPGLVMKFTITWLTVDSQLPEQLAIQHCLISTILFGNLGEMLQISSLSTVLVG